MDDTNHEEWLLPSLSLGVVTDSINRKRKRKCCESKIFRLLQFRDQMLNTTNMIQNGNGLQLIHLLLLTASAVDQNNRDTATQNLTHLYQYVSLIGDSIQRVVAYFADALAARLLTSKSPFYGIIMKQPSPEEELLAFTHLYRVSPFYQFAHFTANQSIIEAFEKEEDINNRALHVIDFDVSYGFQWPSLIQSLSDKATTTNPISLRLTAFGRSLEQLQQTEKRLVGFSKGVRNLVFEFQGLMRGSKAIINSRIRKNETVAVNLVFHLNTLKSISETIKYVRALSPSVVILVEQEGSRSPRSFLSRFMESLHYYAAMFDSLDDCLPLDSAERLNIEKNHLGKEIKSMMNYDREEEEDGNSCPIYQRMEIWKGKMEKHGFGGLNLSSKSMIQAKLLLKIGRHCCPLQYDGESGGGAGFRVFERDDGRAISLGWQDRCLITASAWHCV